MCFSDNESLFDGGAIYNRSADFNSESISTIKNSLFVGNQSTQGSSGAIHNLAINYAEASAKIYSSTFYDNSSFNVGAILFSNTQLTDATSNSEIENCIFMETALFIRALYSVVRWLRSTFQIPWFRSQTVMHFLITHLDLACLAAVE